LGWRKRVHRKEGKKKKKTPQLSHAVAGGGWNKGFGAMERAGCGVSDVCFFFILHFSLANVRIVPKGRYVQGYDLSGPIVKICSTFSDE